MSQASARRFLSVVAPAVLCCAGAALGQTPTQGPDIIVGDLPDVTSNSVTTINGVAYDSFAVGTTSCNKGNTPVNWFTGGTDNRHPAISQNIYRYVPAVGGAPARFEQIGQGQLKHGFTALQGSTCTSYFGFGCNATAGTTLGVGCSDPYGSGLNNVVGSGGPKWQVNAATGLFPFPVAVPVNAGPPRVRLSDLNSAPVGTRYFIEGQYIVGDDAEYGTGQNKNNNASWREVNITPSAGTIPNATEFGIAISSGSGGVVHREQAGIYAWQAIDPAVTIVTTDVPGDGRLILGCRVTGPVGGLYSYEYALHNLNSNRCAGSFIVPMPAGHGALGNVGFHDAEIIGEPNALANPADPASDDWSLMGSEAGSPQVAWTGPTYSGTQAAYMMNASTAFKVDSFVPGSGNDHSANVIRWGSMFNFRFTSEAAPGAGGSVAVGLFRPGTGTAVVIAGVPTPGGTTVNNLTASCCTGAVCSVATQPACGTGTWGTPGTTCAPDPCVPGTCCISGVCSASTLPLCTGTWSAGGSCTPNPCPIPSGACCAAAACSVVQRPSCGGMYQGDNSTCSQVFCPAGNDACANAVALSDGAPSNGTTIGATNDGTDSCGAAATSPDVWYSYTPAVTASVNVDLCSNTGYDSVLSIHSGACPGAAVACNDDSCNLQSRVTATLTAGVRYLIRVSGFGGATGTFTVLVTGGQGPPGSCCATSGSCGVTARTACSGAWTGGGTCTPNTCVQPGNGACCAGTVCTVGAQLSCTGLFQGAGSACGTAGNPTTCCPANINGVGGVSVQDLFDFLAAWFARTAPGDFNHDGSYSVQDIADFLGAWFRGC